MLKYLQNYFTCGLCVWILNVKGENEPNRTALIIIDVQTCFTAGGTLEVANGDQVIILLLFSVYNLNLSPSCKVYESIIQW